MTHPTTSFWSGPLCDEHSPHLQTNCMCSIAEPCSPGFVYACILVRCPHYHTLGQREVAEDDEEPRKKEKKCIPECGPDPRRPRSVMPRPRGILEGGAAVLSLVFPQVPFPFLLWVCMRLLAHLSYLLLWRLDLDQIGDAYH